MKQHIRPARLAGTVPIPGSKSHTIRALLVAGLAEGESRILHPLDSEDARSCIRASRLLGAEIAEESGVLTVTGVGGSPRIPENVIDVGNSGTTLYLAAGIAALAGGWTFFTGDGQIRRRSAANLLSALEDLGARTVSARGNGCAPFAIGGPLRGGETSIECPTSQYLSSLLLAAPLARGTSEIRVPLLHERPYVEMTLSWLDGQGISYERDGLQWYRIPGGQHYRGFERRVPADFSSATFFLCAAALTGSTLTLEGLDMSDSQGDKAVVGMLREMGCTIEENPEGITIRGGRLFGCELDLNATPDALPALAAAACFAEGTTRLTNVPQARMKETDRIRVMAEELGKMGADIEEEEDGLVIRGSELHGCEVDGRGDHRVVMALAVAGLGARGETVIDGAEAAAVTFPDFFELLQAVTA